MIQIPFPLVESQTGNWNSDESSGSLSVTALPHSDLYCNPKGESSPDVPSVLNALTLLGSPRASDFQFSAKVSVDFKSTYDAGVLLIWRDERTWAKLCFEYSPDREAMVVSVVTLGASDDANSFTVPHNAAWLRISRMERVYAFHASHDANNWKLVRVFTLGSEVAEHKVGFEAQAPIGSGCQITFEDIKFTETSLAELRDGS